MNEKNKWLVEISKTIMHEAFKYAETEMIDDVDLIKEVKRIIVGCQVYCKKENKTEDEIKLITEALEVYSQEKYLSMWEKGIDEDERDSYDEIMKEGLDTYNYLFKYEEHKGKLRLW